MFKRILRLGLSVAMVLVLVIGGIVAAEGQELTEEKMKALRDADWVNWQEIEEPLVIGYTPSDWDPADFHGMFGSGIEKKLNELGIDFEMRIRAAGGHADHEIQLSIVEDFLAEGVDFIVINPTDMEAQRTVYETIREAGVPYIVGNYRGPFPEEWGYQPVMFAGYSHEDAGIIMANYIADNYPKGTKIAIIHGVPGYITYARAATDLHKELGNEIIFEEYADFDRIAAYDYMERIIIAHPEAEVVLAMSSSMAIGAVEATRAHGVEDDYDIYGAGGTFEELRYIEQGLLTGAWMRDPIAMGEAVAQAIVDYMNSNKDQIPVRFDSPIHMLTSVEDINMYAPAILFESQGYEFPRPIK